MKWIKSRKTVQIPEADIMMNQATVLFFIPYPVDR
jgi:hypothetical protein